MGGWDVEGVLDESGVARLVVDDEDEGWGGRGRLLLTVDGGAWEVVDGRGATAMSGGSFIVGLAY